MNKTYMSYKLWKSLNEKKLDENLAFNLGVHTPGKINTYVPTSEEITEEEISEAKKMVDKMKKMHYMKKMAGTMKEEEDLDKYSEEEILEAILLEMKKKKKKKMDGDMEEPAPEDDEEKAEKPEEAPEEEPEEGEEEEEEEEEEDSDMTCAHCGKMMKKKMKKKMKKESVVDTLARWASEVKRKNSNGWTEYMS